MRLFNRVVRGLSVKGAKFLNKQNGLLSETSFKNIFRLTSILCIVFIFCHDNFFEPQKVFAAEHGIGGGLIEHQANDQDFSEMEALILSETVETDIFEPDAFSMTHILQYTPHVVKKDENISGLAVNFGLNQDTIISINKITNTRLIQIGQVLKIPNQDGIIHNVKNRETLDSIAERYKASPQAIKIANELFSEDVKAGTDIFIPGAKLDWVRLQEINGDLFIWPISGYITSPYGYRKDPFNPSRRQFHSGIDIRGSTGTPVRAAMAGRVSRVGYDSIYGNHIIVNHHSGYRTLYAHLSVIRTRTGAYVAMGERIGDVGSTGLSTGPHLHFTVYKNGVTVNPRTLMR